MPLCTIYLLSLQTTTPAPIPTFLSTLSSTSLKPLVVSRVIRWIILPTELSTSELLARNIHWDILLILPSTSSSTSSSNTPSPFPKILQNQIAHKWSLTAGIPSRLLSSFASKNHALLHPDPDPTSNSIPPLTGALDEPKVASSAQGLELSPELSSWIRSFSEQGGEEGKGAVSMLNLLAFREGMKGEYLKYGAAFAESIGVRRGGVAKIVGMVVSVSNQNQAKSEKDKEKTTKAEEKGSRERQEEGDDGWHEIALAHYPSILHFADMLASQDYQEVNQRFRVPSLRDTCILCTSEIGVEEMCRMGEGKGMGKGMGSRL